MSGGSRVAKAKKQAVSAHDLDRIIVRLPPGMRDQIADMAEANGRSMTAEVVAALEQHLKGPDRLAGIEAFIEQNREDIEAIGTIWQAVESLESYAEGMGDGFRGHLRAILQKSLRELRESKMPTISADQAKEIRRLLKTSGANEQKFLRYMKAEKIEDIRDFEKAVGAIHARDTHMKNPPA